MAQLSDPEPPTKIAVGDHRHNNLDLLRLVFAFAVLLSHSYPLVTGKGDDEPLLRLSRYHATLGGLAVDFFFVVSGFLITGSYFASRTTRVFLQSAVLSHIFPGYAVAVCVCLAVVAPIAASGPGHGYLLKLAARGAAVEPLTSSAVFVNNPFAHVVNGSLWTIRYEFCCYLLVLGLGRIGALRRPVLMLFILASVVLLSFAVRLSPVLRTEYLLFGRFDVWCRFIGVFLIGANLYLWRQRIVLSLPLAVAALVVAVGSIYVRPAEIATIILELALSYVIYWMAFTHRLRFHNFGRMGDFSYGTYLYAWPVQQLLVYYFISWITPVRLFLMAAPLTFLLAVASWFLVERPFLKLKPRPAFASGPER